MEFVITSKRAKWLGAGAAFVAVKLLVDYLWPFEPFNQGTSVLRSMAEEPFHLAVQLVTGLPGPRCPECGGRIRKAKAEKVAQGDDLAADESTPTPEE